MSETSHSFGIFLPRVPGIITFQAESGRVTPEWQIGWAATKSENPQQQLSWTCVFDSSRPPRALLPRIVAADPTTAHHTGFHAYETMESITASTTFSFSLCMRCVSNLYKPGVAVFGASEKSSCAILLSMRLNCLVVKILSIGFCSAGLLAESAAGVHWTAPAGFKAEAPQPMRAATYTVLALPGDKANAECAVYFFGAGQGGSVEANIERWKGQFKGVDGKPAPAKIAKRTTSFGMTITTIDTSGDYSGLGGPLSSGQSVPGYRLLGGIVQAPGGNIFVKFTGPAKTIAANEAKFEQLITSFKPDK
jgi:hypothetical protein